jgi:hypothetical protein
LLKLLVAEPVATEEAVESVSVVRAALVAQVVPAGSAVSVVRFCWRLPAPEIFHQEF